MATKEEVIFKVKADLAEFKKSMDSLKKIAKESSKNIEKAMDMNLTDEGSRAGKSFSRGIDSQLKDITNNIKRELGKISEQASEIEIGFDTSGLDAIKKQLANIGDNVSTASDRASSSMNNNANAPNNESEIVEALNRATPVLYSALGSIRSEVSKTFNQLSTESVSAFDRLKNAASSAGNQISQSVGRAVNTSLRGIWRLGDALANGFGKLGKIPAIERLGHRIQYITKECMESIPYITAKISNFGRSIADGIFNKIGSVINLAGNEVVKFGNRIVGLGIKVLNPINAFKLLGRTALSTVRSFGSAGWNAITNSINRMYQGIKKIPGATRSAFESIRSSIGRGLNSAFTSASNGINKFKSNIRSIPSTARSMYGSVNNSIKNIGHSISSAGFKIKTFANDIKGNTIKAATNLKNGLGSAIDKVKNSMNGFSEKIRSSFSNIGKGAESTKKAAKGIKEMGDAANGATGKVSKLKSAFIGLLGKLGMFFGIYQILSWFKEGTKDAMQYEASIMQLQRRLGDASKTLVDFANNNATAFGISKKQVAEYGNIYSVFVSEFAKSAEENAQITQKLLESAGTIASATGYDLEYVLQGLRSGIMGSTQAIDQFGLSVKVGKLQTTELFKELAAQEGVTAFSELSAEAQRYIITQEILNQTTANYGGVIKNTASMHNQFTAQLANTKLALGNVGKAIWTAVLPALTSIMAVLEKVFNYVAKVMSAILGLFGIEVNFSEGGGTSGAADNLANGLDNVGDAAGGASDALGDAADAAKDVGGAAKDAAKDTEKAAKDMKRALAGFDQINVLSLGKDSDSTDPGGGSGGGGGGTGGGGGGGGGTGGGGGAGNLNDALTEVTLTNNGALDNLSKKMQEMFDKIKEGFNSVFDYSVFDELKASLESIKQSIKNIFDDPAVKDAAKAATDEWLVTFGKMIGALATFGLELANGILGGLADSLVENEGYIKEKLISIFDISKDIASNLGDLASGFAEIFRSLGSESAKDFWSQIFSIAIITELGIEEITGKIVRDFVGLFSTAVNDNASSIREAWENIFQYFADILGVLKEAITDLFAEINKVYDEHVKPFIDKLTESYSTCVGNMADGFNTHMKPVLDSMADKFSKLYKEHLKPLIEKLGEFSGTIIDCISKIWETWLKPFFEWLTKDFFANLAPKIEWLGGIASAVIGAVCDIIGDLLDILGGLIKFITGTLTGDWEMAWEGVKDVVSGIVSAIGDLFKGLWETIKAIFKPVTDWFKEKFNAAKDAVKKAWDGVCDFFKDIWEGIKKIFDPDTWFGVAFADGADDAEGAFDGTPEFFKGIWKGIKDAFNGVKKWFSDLFSGAWTSIKTAWNGATGWFGDIWTGIKNAFPNVKKWFSDTFSGAWDGIKKAWSNVTGWFDDIWESIKGAFDGAKDWKLPKPSISWGDLKDIAGDALDKVKEKITKFTASLPKPSVAWDSIKDTAQGFIDKAKEKVTGFTASLPKPTLSWDSIKDTAKGFVDKAKEKVTGFAASLPKPTVSWDSIKDTAKTYIDKAKEKVTGFSASLPKPSVSWDSIATSAKSFVDAAKKKVTECTSSLPKPSVSWSSLATSAKSAVDAAKKKVTSFSASLPKPSVSWSSLATSAKSAVDNAKKKVTGFSASLPKPKISWNLASSVGDAISAAKKKMNFSWSLPKPKTPKFTAQWKTVFGVKIPSGFSISWHAKGGIMTKPTIFGINGNNLLAGGEAGHEAVLPLEKLWSQLANQFNRQNEVLSSTVASVGSGSSGPVNITLKINDIEMGKAVINSLKALSDHSGEIDLPL